MSHAREEQDAADRISEVLRVAVDALGPSERAIRFLDAPSPALADAKPAEIAAHSQVGLVRVLTLLRQIDR